LPGWIFKNVSTPLVASRPLIALARSSKYETVSASYDVAAPDGNTRAQTDQPLSSPPATRASIIGCETV